MKGGKGKIHEHPNRNTNGFDKNPQNIGKGRKPSIYTVLKNKGYSKQDVKACFNELAFYTVDELSEVIDDEKLPIIQKIVANQFLKAFKSSDWAKIREILEHSIGKPTQHIVQEETLTKIEIETIDKKG